MYVNATMNDLGFEKVDDDDDLVAGGGDVGKADASDDYQRGDEIIVDDLPEWRHPVTADVVYHTGSMKVTDANGAWFRISADEIDEVVSKVETEPVTDGGRDVSVDDVTELEPGDEIMSRGGIGISIVGWSGSGTGEMELVYEMCGHELTASVDTASTLAYYEAWRFVDGDGSGS